MAEPVKVENLGGVIARSVGGGYAMCYYMARAAIRTVSTGQTFNDCMNEQEETIDRTLDTCTTFGNRHSGFVLSALRRFIKFSSGI